jgi:enamine deaminase RidA (YjgF/YER057c/UK114 family)
MHWTPIDPATVSPPPGGWFSHAAKVGLEGTGLMFVSGQVAFDDEGKLVGEGALSIQTEQVFTNLARILADQGGSLNDIVNIRTFLTDISRISEYGAVRARYLTGTPPTSTTVQVAGLVTPGALVEIDVVAVIDHRRDRPTAPPE